MLNIPSSCKVTLTSEKANTIIERLGGGSTLKGMEFMQTAWENQCDSEAFFDCFYTEANAYNVVLNELEKMFG